MTKIINCTTHLIKDLRTDNTYEPSGKVARVEVVTHQKHLDDGATLFVPVYGEVQGLPAVVEEGVYYIVSAIVLNALQHVRADLISPTGTVKDTKGHIIGCQGFRANKM